MLDVKDFYLQEGLIPRSSSDMSEYLKSNGSDIGHFDKYAESYFSGQIIYNEFFNAMTEKVNGISLYDLAKSRSLDNHIWVLESVKKKISKTKPRSLLDMCCGTGLEALYIAENFPEIKVTGIDKLEKMIKISKDRTTNRNLRNIEFLVGDFNSLLSNYDVIMCLHGLNEDVDDFYKHYELDIRLRKMHESLNNNGSLILNIPLDESIEYRNKEMNILKDDIESVGFTVNESFSRSFTTLDNTEVTDSLFFAIKK